MSLAESPQTDFHEPSWDWKSDPEFLEQLLSDLRRQAAVRIRCGVRAISVSSLVQESLIKILDASLLEHPDDRRYIYSLAARAMRFVVVDHVRAQQTLKRGQGRTKTNVDSLSGVIEANHLEILAIHEALEELAKRDERQARVVEMKFFAGCTMPEIAEHLGYAVSTIELDWNKAKQFLLRFLSC